MKKRKSQKLWDEAKKIIPGGTQLLSKRAEMFLPEQWPAYYRSAKGIEVVDLDGRKYLDMSLMGVGSCVLGYADTTVNKAVKKAIDRGSMSTLNAPEEVALATVLLRLHPWAQGVRYARTGGEAMTIAVRIARAHTGKDRVAFCGYHGWHDWYLAANLADDKNLDGHLLSGLEPVGVPRVLKGTALPFSYNHLQELEGIIEKHQDIGVIVVEPLRHQEPTNDFLRKVRDIAKKINAVLIFDEISIGWRLNIGGVHLRYGVTPDIAVFGKAMSNGYPMAAIIGTKTVMNAAHATFISSTYWTERIGPVAALATIRKMTARNVPRHLAQIGTMIGEVWRTLAVKHRLKITVRGPLPLISFSFDDENPQELKTLFVQEMLRRGFLAGLTVYVSYSHRRSHIKKYAHAVDEVFAILHHALARGSVNSLLEGPVAHRGFTRLT